MAQRDVTIRISAVDNFQAVMQKYNQEMDKAEKNTRELGKSSDNLAGTLKGLFTIAMVQQVAGYVGEMVNLGTEANATEDRFRALTSTMGSYESTMAGLRKATLGTTDDMHLQAGAMLLVQTAGIETSDELERMMNLITMTKKPAEDMTTAISNFGLMLANNSILRLDSFGISASKVRARIIELQQTMGLDRSEAFRMAVLEEGEKNIRKFGDAADVASNSLSRLGVAAQNAIQDLAQLSAQGAQGFGLAIEFALGMTPQQQAQQQAVIDQTAITLAMDFQEALDAAMAGAGDGINTNIVSNFVKESLSLAVSDPSLMSDVDAFMSRIFQNLGVTVGDTGPFREILEQTLQIQAANQSERDIAIEIANGQQAIADVEAERLANAEAIESVQREINHLGQDAGEIFTNVGEAIVNMGMDAAAEQAAKLREELAGMSLSDLFGTTDGGRLGEIGDMITEAMEGLNKSTESITNFQTAMDNLSGRNTSSENLITNVITPTIASIADVDPAQATMMATNLNNIMSEAFLQGVDVNAPAFISALSEQFSATDFQLIDPQQFLDSLEPSNEIAVNMGTMAEDGSIIKDAVAFWGEQAPAISGEMAAAAGSVKTIATELDKVSKTTTKIPVQLEWVNMSAMIQALMPGLVQAVQSAGGVMPGTDARASTSGPMVRQGQGAF